MTTRQSRLRRRRDRLFADDPHCHWCECLTRLLDRKLRHGEKMPLDLATIDHLDDRLSPERGKHKGEDRTVLACWKCNNDRNREAQAAYPVEMLRERSGRNS